MSKSYGGDQILAKVRQASNLIEQGRPLREVWASVKISRQTYNRWKEICDSVQSELEARTQRETRHLDSLSQQNNHLQIELEKTRDQARQYKESFEAANHRLGTLSVLKDQLDEVQEARRQRDKLVEDLKGRLSDAEKRLQEAVAADKVLQDDNISSRDHLNRTPGNAVEAKHKLAGERDTGTLRVVSSDREQATERSVQGSRFAKSHKDTKGLSRVKRWPIGIHIEDECITMVQLGMSRDGIAVVEAKKVISPHGVEPQSSDWGRWAVNALRDSIQSGGFRNRKVCLALPVRDTFIDHVTMPNSTLDLPAAVFEAVRRKLPYNATRENTIVKWIPTEGSQVIAIALERKSVDRCLAICEKTHLKPETFSVWPLAMISTYSLLPAKTDDSFAMLLDVAANHTNIVICRDKKLYYARSTGIGARDLAAGAETKLLTDQIDACRMHFARIYGNRLIRQGVFFVGKAVNRETIAKVAEQVGIPAQLGDPFAVMKLSDRNAEEMCLDKTSFSWLAAIGVGLEEVTNQSPPHVLGSKVPKNYSEKSEQTPLSRIA